MCQSYPKNKSGTFLWLTVYEMKIMDTRLEQIYTVSQKALGLLCLRSLKVPVVLCVIGQRHDAFMFIAMSLKACFLRH